MPSSTSSFERVVPSFAWGRALGVAGLLCIGGLAGWEQHWRSEGFEPSSQNTDDLWASARRRVQDQEGETVFIGSSRILFNTDVERWREQLKAPATIQLALEGTSPLPYLHDLAQDPDFDGFLVVGATPGIVFDDPSGPRLGALSRSKNQTPAQRSGQWLSLRMERVFAFLDSDTRLFTQIERLDWPETRGMRPALRMPRKLLVMDETRNTRMWKRVEEDEAYQQLARDIWMGFMDIPSPPPKQEMLDKNLAQVQEDIAAIRARGGEVIFVRCPSNGKLGEIEKERRPRAEFWDPFIEQTGSFGVHYEDHPEFQDLWLPEWSHVASTDQAAFTDALVEIVRPYYENWAATK